MKSINGYILCKPIGKGSFGEVYKTKKEDKLFATKKLEINIIKNKSLKKYLYNEIEIMKKLNHPNIIHFYEYFMTTNNYYIIMDYCNGGSLSDLLKEYKLKFGKPFPQEIIQYFMHHIVNGLKYIHSQGIIHRDIKMDNILLNFKNINDKKKFNIFSSQVILVDFGLATYADRAKTLVGCPLNMDPLILKKYTKAGGYNKLQLYNEKADIWSLGTICYEMLTGETLYNVENIQELIEKVEEGNYSIPIHFSLSKEMISFLNSMLQYNREKRWSAAELSVHEFLTKNVKDFTKVNLEKISYKIENGAIILNTKENSTVWKIIKNDNKNKEDNNNLGCPGVAQINKKDKAFLCGIVSPLRISKKNFIQNIESKDIEKNELKQISNNFLKSDNDEKMKNTFEKPIDNAQQGNILNENGQNNNYINDLLNEYKNAMNYFKKNNLKTQELDAINKYIQINNIKSQIESGNLIDLNNLPKPITPEYIYGCSTKERNEKFNELINKFSSDKKILEAKMKNFEKYAITKNIKEEYDKEHEKLKKLEYIIKKLENNYKNEWTPAPEYTKEYKKTHVEKISYENCDYKLLFTIKKIENKEENINLYINFIVNENKEIRKNFELKGENNFKENWEITLNVNDWKNIDINSDNFILNIDTDKDNFNQNYPFIVDIRKAKKGKGVTFNLPHITKTNEKEVIKFNIIPIIPLGKKYIGEDIKQFILLKELLPPFEGKSIFTSKIKDDIINF